MVRGVVESLATFTIGRKSCDRSGQIRHQPSHLFCDEDRRDGIAKYAGRGWSDDFEHRLNHA